MVRRAAFLLQVSRSVSADIGSLDCIPSSDSCHDILIYPGCHKSKYQTSLRDRKSESARQTTPHRLIWFVDACQHYWLSALGLQPQINRRNGLVESHDMGTICRERHLRDFVYIGRVALGRLPCHAITANPPTNTPSRISGKSCLQYVCFFCGAGGLSLPVIGL